MKDNCLGGKDRYAIERKCLDIGFMEFMTIELCGNSAGLLSLLSIPEKIARGAKDLFYHMTKTPHTHVTLRDYLVDTPQS